MKASSYNQPTKPSVVPEKRTKKKSHKGLTCTLLLLIVLLLIAAGGFLVWTQYGPQIAENIAAYNIIITTSTATPSQVNPTQSDNPQEPTQAMDSTATALPTPQPTATTPPSPTPTQTPLASLTPLGTGLPAPTNAAVETYPYDLAFVSNRDGTFILYVMDTANPQDWRALSSPEGYEIIRWPSFCGSRLLFEADDRALTLPRWVFAADIEQDTLEPFSLPAGVDADRLAAPTCSPSGRYMGVSVYKNYAWYLDILDLTQPTLIFEQKPGEYPMLGYASWGQAEDSFLWMGVRTTGYFDINETSGYLAPGSAAVRLVEQGKYPVLSPAGDSMAYFCGNMLGLCLTAWPSGEVVSQKTINYYKKIDGEIVSASAAWSRDGKWIYFNSSPAGNWDIYRMHPDGSELQNLTADWPSDEIMPTAR
jgi:hypothetical protein